MPWSENTWTSKEGACCPTVTAFAATFSSNNLWTFALSTSTISAGVSPVSNVLRICCRRSTNANESSFPFNDFSNCIESLLGQRVTTFIPFGSPVFNRNVSFKPADVRYRRQLSMDFRTTRQQSDLLAKADESPLSGGFSPSKLAYLGVWT